MNIILYGFKSSGKTTLGKQLAAKLHWQFIDVDDLIKNLYQEKTAKSLPVYKIYELNSDTFILLETEVIASLAGTDNAVIATGGGSVLNPENVKTLKKLGKLIHLKLAKEFIKARMLKGRLPAFLDINDPEGSFEKMYLAREQTYNSIADIVIDINNKNDNEVVKEIIQEVQHGQ